MRYYKNSTGVVYDLISEGPISLVNGLSSIYLDRRPIANQSVARKALGSTAKVYLNADGTRIVTGAQRLGIPTYFPILIKRGAKQGTATVEENSYSLTVDNFFTTDMLASNSEGDGGLYQKVRIPGAGPGGTEYEGEVLSINAETNTATMDKPFYRSMTGSVYYDHFGYAIETNNAGTYSIILTPPATNSVLFNANNGASVDRLAGTQETWTSCEAILGSGSNSLNDPLSTLNFRNVKVNFRNGTGYQDPTVNMSGFSSASFGIAPNVELSQVASAKQENGTEIPIYKQKTNPWWTNDNLEEIKPELVGGSPYVLTTGVDGLNVSAPSEIDEIVITINAPQGIYGLKANEKQSKTNAGAVFQIYLEYKVAAAATWQRKLVLGPTQQDLNNASAYLVHNEGALKKGGNYTAVLNNIVESAVNFDFRINLQEFKPFDDFRIEIYKITPDQFKVGKWTYYQDTTLATVQALIHDKLSYPHSAYAAIEFDSQEFQGSFPERAYHCYGVDMDLPTNYITREEALDGIANYNGINGIDTGEYQVWNGTFRRGYSNNPVWNLRELLLNKRWGLGNWLSADQINKYSFYSLARYCDELVPDGAGGLEPRFTCGVYLTQKTEAYKVIKDFATTMLALPYWVDGQFIIEGDRPGEPVYTFTKGNVEGGIFSYEGTGSRVRTNQVAVTFNDKNNFYEQSVELIDDIDNIIETNRVITEEVVAFGATSQSQAIRYGRWKLLTAKLQKEIISFKTGENAGYLKPGSIIYVQDADRYKVRASGRIAPSVTNSTTTVTLDRAVTLSANEQYDLHIFIPGSAVYLLQDSATFSGVTYNKGDQLPSELGTTSEELASQIVDDNGDLVAVQFVKDGHIESRSVISSAGSRSTLSVDSGYTSIPESEAIWALTAKSNGSIILGSPKMYRILGISEEGKGVYSINAVEHYNAKFDIIDEDYLSDRPQYVSRYAEVPAPNNFTASITYNSDGVSSASTTNQSTDINLSWEAPVLNGEPYTAFDGYELKYNNAQGDLITIRINSDDTNYVLKNVSEGTYEFFLQAVSATGPASTTRFARASVSSETYVSGKELLLSLLKGGEFNKPIAITGNELTIATEHTFISPTGARRVNLS
jgi:predicted phage tail protein